MQKKKQSWSPLPNLFHRVTDNPKHTIILLGLVCMYLLSHVCIKNIFDLPDAQGLVTIQVNILSMYKHIQGRTSFYPRSRQVVFVF